MSFIMRPIRFASTGHIIEGSGLFDGSTGYLKRTMSTPTNNKIFTISMITKLNDDTGTLFFGGTNFSSNFDTFQYSSDMLDFQMYHSSSIVGRIRTTQLLRDPSAYYHIILAVNTSTGISGTNKLRMYINGVEVTDFETDTNPSNDQACFINSAVEHDIGSGLGNYYCPMYCANVTFIDGLQLDPTSFGEVTDDGFWSISDASGLTYSGNSFLIEGGVDMAAGVDSSQGGTLADQQLRFLCSFDGSDAATSSTDDSTYGQTITFTADAQLDTAQYKFGTASLLLDGTGDYVTIPDFPTVEIGSQDFTIDMQVRFTTLAAIRTLMAKWHSTDNNRSFLLYWENSAAQLQFLVSANGSSVAATIAESWSPSTNTWYHVAVERTGGNIHLYIDGTMLGSGTANTTAIFNSTTPLSIGAYQSGSQPFLGHIDESRLIIGDGVYGGSNFTAPAAAYSNPTAGNNFVKTGTITATNDSPTNGDA